MPQRAITLATLLAGVLCLAAVPACAEDRAVPYWASLRADKPVNMHVGPSRDYAIAWVYRRRFLPLKVLRLKEGWRLVEDPDGARGWMLAQFLSPERGALVAGRGPADMRAAGSPDAPLKWRLEPGLAGLLGDCAANWCRLDLGDGHAGFVEQARLWGTAAP